MLLVGTPAVQLLDVDQRDPELLVKYVAPPPLELALPIEELIVVIGE